MSTLNNIKKETNTTIIIVAHRLASISNANKIVVLNEGKVDGEGKHIELLDKNSWYAQAWNLQNN
jgi:ATP-binding cassette subfamily B protein